MKICHELKINLIEYRTKKDFVSFVFNAFCEESEENEVYHKYPVTFKVSYIKRESWQFEFATNNFNVLYGITPNIHKAIEFLNPAEYDYTDLENKLRELFSIQETISVIFNSDVTLFRINKGTK